MVFQLNFTQVSDFVVILFFIVNLSKLKSEHQHEINYDGKKVSVFFHSFFFLWAKWRRKTRQMVRNKNNELLDFGVFRTCAEQKQIYVKWKRWFKLLSNSKNYVILIIFFFFSFILLSLVCVRHWRYSVLYTVYIYIYSYFSWKRKFTFLRLYLYRFSVVFFAFFFCLYTRFLFVCS